MRKKLNEFIKAAIDFVYAICASLMAYEMFKNQKNEFDIIIAIIASLLAGIFAYNAVCNAYESWKMKKRMQKENEGNLYRIYKPYVKIVEKELSKRYEWKHTFYPTWVEKFDKMINSYSKAIKEGKFTDFDVSACLVCALLLDNKESNKIEFALDCIKPIIIEPKVYMKFERKKRTLKIVVQETMTRIDPDILEEEAKKKGVISNIEAYASAGKLYGIANVSYFLQMFYERCLLLTQKKCEAQK